MQFECDGENVQILSLEAVNHIAQLTATDPDGVIKSLLYRTVATGGGEVIEKGHTEQQACFGRDAFAKVTKWKKKKVKPNNLWVRKKQTLSNIKIHIKNVAV